MDQQDPWEVLVPAAYVGKTSFDQQRRHIRKQCIVVIEGIAECARENKCGAAEAQQEESEWYATIREQTGSRKQGPANRVLERQIYNFSQPCQSISGFAVRVFFEDFISFSVDNLHSVDNYRIFALEVQRFSDQLALTGLRSPILSPFIKTRSVLRQAPGSFQPIFTRGMLFHVEGMFTLKNRVFLYREK
jgi:hypothetical protein